MIDKELSVSTNGDPDTVNVKIIYTQDGEHISNAKEIYSTLKPYLGKTMRDFIIVVDNYVSDNAALTLAEELLAMDDRLFPTDHVSGILRLQLCMNCLHIAQASRNAFPDKYPVAGEDTNVHIGAVRDTLKYGFKTDALSLTFKGDYDLNCIIPMRQKALEIGKQENLPELWVETSINMLGSFVLTMYYQDRLKALCEPSE